MYEVAEKTNWELTAELEADAYCEWLFEAERNEQIRTILRAL